jgi:hypothetical protein
MSEDPYWNTGNMLYGSNPQDPLGLGIYTPCILSMRQSANLYVYGLNNPLVWRDPSGLRVTHTMGILGGIFGGNDSRDNAFGSLGNTGSGISDGIWNATGNDSTWTLNASHDGTLGVGVEGNIGAGLVLGAGLQIVIDQEGNMGFMPYGKINAGMPTASIGIVVSVSNADSIYDLNGISGSAGGSGEMRLKYATIGYEHFWGESNDKSFSGGTIFIGKGHKDFSVELHGGTTIARVFTIRKNTSNR